MTKQLFFFGGGGGKGNRNKVSLQRAFKGDIRRQAEEKFIPKFGGND